MALPTILVNSGSGSDTAASGAGPGTALFGSNASTNAGGTIATLTGAGDLSGVATDGSAVLFILDATAGQRNFGKITAVNNATKAVTVSDAFQGSLAGKTWAIGGKRASIGGTTSSKLFNNNSAAGDAMPGWIVEMESGHTETLSAIYQLLRNGDTTSGPITLQGTSGAGTRPILTFSNNGNALSLASDFLVAKAFDMVNTNATKTSSIAIGVGTGADGVRIEDIKIADSTNKFWKAILCTASSSGIILKCNVGSTASDGVTLAATSWVALNNYIHNISGNGITLTGSATRSSFVIINNIIYTCTDGINRNSTLAAGDLVVIDRNTIDNNSGDGIELASTPGTSMTGWVVTNNILSNNGAYGFKEL